MKSDKCDSHRVYVDAVNGVTNGTQSILRTSVIVGISNHRVFVSVSETRFERESSKKGYAKVLLNVVKWVQIREVSNKDPKEIKPGNICSIKAKEPMSRGRA